MKNNKHNIDDLFRRSFEGYTVEPSSSVWNNIVRKYFNTGLSTSGLLSIQNIVSILLIVGAGVFVQYGFHPVEKNNEFVSTQIPEITAISNPILTVQTTEENNNFTTDDHETPAKTGNETTTETRSNEIIHTKYPEDQEPQISSESIAHNPQAQPSYNTFLAKRPATPESSTEKPLPNPSNQALNYASLMDTPMTLDGNIYTSIASTIPFLAEKGSDSDMYKSLSSLQAGENLMGAKYNKLLKINKREKDYFRKAHISYRNKYSQIPIQWNNDYLFRSPWALGVLFGYEWIYYPGDSVEKKNGYSIDLTAIYQKDQFLLRSGIGVSVSNDNGEFVIDYQTNDSIGFYYGVNSFNIDPDDPDNPAFDTYIETVYDSIEHTSYEHPENKYTYIQIPLLIGYKVLDINRFSCSLMGGPVLSILVQEDENTIGFSDIGATLINIEDNTPQRLKTNWQFMFSAGLNYRASNHLSLSLEPTYKYYIQSVYEQNVSGTKNPWSIGLRGGVVYTF